MAGRSAGGFALMDVLAALLLLGLFIMPLLLARNNTVLSANETVLLRTANLLAERKMGELLEEDPAALGSAGGDFGEAFPGFTWETEVEVRTVADIVPEAEEEEEEAYWGYGVREDEEEEDDPAVSVREREVTVLLLRVRYPSPLLDRLEGEEPPPAETPEGEPPAPPPGQVLAVRLWVLDTTAGGEDAAAGEADGADAESEAAEAPELLDLFGPAPEGAAEAAETPPAGDAATPEDGGAPAAGEGQ